MAKISLNITGDTSGIDSVIKKVKADLKQLQDVTVKISVDASGLEAVDKTAVKVLQAQAKIADANAKVKISENNLAIAREKSKQSADSRIKSENALATQIEKTATSEEQARRANIQLEQQIEKTNTVQAQARRANIQLEQQIEKTNTVQAQAALQAEKTSTEEAKLAVQQEKTATASTNLEAAQARASRATKEMGDAAEQAGAQAETLWHKISKFASWYFIGGAFSSIVGTFKEALNALKEVDSELVTIRKVTGFNDEQIAGIREQAFSTASAYGVGAADYLESVAQFSRAGYKEQSAALAELSTKTQIVGDTTAEVANQFLLSVDAAYKYKGSITELSKVLDGANEIDNKYATSIEKIAEGLGTVAPVAAQMHVGVDELSAAIGTITAVTQRSGTEAARALRALFLNIAGDTTTEIDEGVTWTTGEISGLADVVKRYATEAYNAAQATGAVIDPMEAIGGLAQSMKEGVLTEQELLSMVSDIGGKLRSSQLLALIQNWDMYQSMLADYGDAIGSADKEVENALDSWERKTEILKNTWTEFISTIINTEAIKTGLDLLTFAVEGLNTGIGQTAVAVGVLTAAVKLLSTASPTSLIISGIAGAIGLLVTVIGGLKDAHEEELQRIRETYPELYSLKDAVDAVNAALSDTENAYKESAAETMLAADMAKEYVKALAETEQGSEEYNAILHNLAAIIPDVNNYIDEETGYLEIQGVELAELIAKWEQLAQQQALTEKATELYKQKLTLEPELKAAEEAYKGVEEQIAQVAAAMEANERLAEGTRYFQSEGRDTSDLDYYAQLGDEYVELRDKLEELTTAEAEYKDELDAAQSAVDGINAELDELKGYFDATVYSEEALAESTGGLTEAAKNLVEWYNELKSALQPVVTALEELDAEGVVSFDTMESLVALYPDLIDAAHLTENGYILERSALEDLIQAKRIEYQLTYDNAMAAAREQVSALESEASAWSMTTLEIKNYLQAKVAALRAQAYEAQNPTYGSSLPAGVSPLLLGTLGNDAGAMADILEGYLNDLNGAETGLRNFDNAVKSLYSGTKVSTGSSGSSGSGGSSSSGSTKDEELEYLKSIVSLREGELSLMQARGDSEDEQIDKIREIQDALHDQAEHLRKSEEYLRGDADAIAAVNALSTKWWKLENDILSIQEKIKKAQDEIVDNFKDEMSDYLDAAEEAAKGPLQEQLDALKAQKDAISDAREEEELLLAVEKARVALANAQNERNVRQYNAATGQWEWVANAQTVQSAEETLLKAEQALAEFYENQAYDAMVASLEQQIDNIEAAYDELRDSVSEIADAIKDGSMTINEAFDYLLIAAATAAAKFGVGGLTEAIVGGGSSFFADSIIDRMKANSAAWHSADESGQQALADENLALGTSMGWHRGEDGYWYDANGNRVYDRGGILRGRGAIKATQSDEMVLPPTMTSSLLKAETSGAFNALMEHLGIVTAAANSYVGFGGGLTRSSIGEQHNGDVFYFNGIEISNVTEGTTMGEFIRRVKTLPLYSGG